MITNNDDDIIRGQLASLWEFTSYLAGSVDTNAEIDPETRNELRTLLPVLKAYGSELERRLEARPATPIYFRLLMLALLDAVRIRHYLVTTFPRLAVYRPADAPTDVPQETMKHLHQAIEVLNEAKAEFSHYLPSPRFPGAIERFVSRGKVDPLQESRWEAEDADLIRQEIKISNAMNTDWERLHESSNTDSSNNTNNTDIRA